MGHTCRPQQLEGFTRVNQLSLGSVFESRQLPKLAREEEKLQLRQKDRKFGLTCIGKYSNRNNKKKNEKIDRRVAKDYALSIHKRSENFEERGDKKLPPIIIQK